MTSNINTTNLDTLYPLAGQDNDSQGFRDNFANIKTNLDTAKSEITDLQANVARTDGNVDFNGSLVSNANFINTSKELYNTGPFSGSQNVVYTDGEVQKITISDDITLTITAWPDSDKYAELLIYLYTSNTDSTVSTVTWQSAGGGILKANSTFLRDGSNNCITEVSDDDSPVVVKLCTFDGGLTVFIQDLGYFF